MAMEPDTIVAVAVIGTVVFIMLCAYIGTTSILYNRTDTLNSNQRAILQTSYNATLDMSTTASPSNSRTLVQFDSNVRRLYVWAETMPEAGTVTTIDVRRRFKSRGAPGQSVSLLTTPIALSDQVQAGTLLNFSQTLQGISNNQVSAGDVVEIIVTTTSADMAGLLISAQLWAPQQNSS